ncbi:cytochrome c [Candidatus Pelagibacter ubique]|jgi:cytochrome c556|uniref:c-type cytochrome n=1 Tax=Pelagibacter ubique TaxID=198252 RepID=UPI0023100FCB|nr:cytochrome c [Candidatus Pelagibacter ubique]MDA7446207.1 cytochrome c [Candidatus Pelagibacter ubique]MDA7488211.1 cytochrome c [Candidatus Pelagibacter ubique]MDA8988577.1 cytochrome c [Candidatus Pelagibacter ubique]MDA9195128.1 cytochrome c [Candidatus Pelagibacter ubique]MDB9750563.1 cytochrome c [Candidatus Pelagibacter ubique]
MTLIKNTLFFIFILFYTFSAYSEQTVEEIIKERQSIFSKNYKTAKRINSLASNGSLDEAKILMIEMSDNYKRLLDLFPENSKTGFETEALPSIWENKDEFNLLMTKASSNMIELTSAIDGADDVKATLGKYMWSSCKSCHSKFRAEH